MNHDLIIFPLAQSVKLSHFFCINSYTKHQNVMQIAKKSL